MVGAMQLQMSRLRYLQLFSNNTGRLSDGTGLAIQPEDCHHSDQVISPARLQLIEVHHQLSFGSKSTLDLSVYPSMMLPALPCVHKQLLLLLLLLLTW